MHPYQGLAASEVPVAICITSSPGTTHKHFPVIVGEAYLGTRVRPAIYVTPEYYVLTAGFRCSDAKSEASVPVKMFTTACPTSSLSTVPLDLGVFRFNGSPHLTPIRFVPTTQVLKKPIGSHLGHGAPRNMAAIGRARIVAPPYQRTNMWGSDGMQWVLCSAYGASTQTYGALTPPMHGLSPSKVPIAGEDQAPHTQALTSRATEFVNGCGPGRMQRPLGFEP
ncbi:hypothetical protein GY45DRAFT_233398 [Cubamyces sp. BRFM 1775]|nr:hypothetical protein GY45DRAFT_233398 [Cubamyces sp. BRFM 1775]